MTMNGNTSTSLEEEYKVELDDEMLRRYFSPSREEIVRIDPKRVYEAEEAADENRLYANLGQAAATIGSGIAGGASPDPAPFQQLHSSADVPVKNLERQARYATDQNKILRDWAKMKAVSEDKALDREVKAAPKKSAPGSGKKGAPSVALTPGERALDVDFGKSLTEWTTTGRASVQKNLKRLEDALAFIEKNDWVSGPMRSLAPDRLRDPRAVATRDDVQAAAQGSLKAILGSQFTEKEGQRIMKAAYNEALPTTENAKKIRAAIKELKDGAAQKEAQIRHFQKLGTLKGVEPSATVVPESGVGPFEDPDEEAAYQKWKAEQP